MSARQQDLFDDAPWEQDDKAYKYFATVVFTEGLPGEFDYLVQEEHRESLSIGARVQVPLGRGNRLVDGFCVNLHTSLLEPKIKYKHLAFVVDENPLITEQMMKVTQWISKRYLCGWGQVLDAVLPSGVKKKSGTRMTKFVFLSEAYLKTNNEIKLPPKQQKIVSILKDSEGSLTVKTVCQIAKCTVAPVNSLLDKKILQAEFKRTSTQLFEQENVTKVENFKLNEEQQNAVTAITEALQQGLHQAFLMFGVTGSGKTEVYIQAIQETVKFGKQAIVLVPEISLTPQTVERFRSRFPSVAVLHSHLTDAERHHQWELISTGKVQVVVGARSAIFAPVPQLGLIVIDEEHEGTFKQDTVPRYHAREVAEHLCKDLNIPLVLGSATPSLESWYRAGKKEYQLIPLRKRINDRPMPAVRTVDLREDSNTPGGRSSLGRMLRTRMDSCLQANGQVILLLNRRGFSTHIQCPQCGFVCKCDSCDIALTFHRDDNIVMCHYCDYQTRAPQVCPECKSPAIRYGGLGTQRLEAEVNARFKQYTALRMDTDTMQAPGSHQKALNQFRNGDVQILLGTQMIAKGLDFPNVTLVGVINADTALHLPDFRAGERTFGLLAQVAGRTGRGEKGGQVLVQTYTPDHPSIVTASKHDFVTFAKGELAQRKLFGYPPYTSMIRIVIRGPKEKETELFAEELTKAISLLTEELDPKVTLRGPAPAAIAKLRDKFRFHLQITHPDGEALRDALRVLPTHIKTPGKIEWIMDVDPISML